ncbi:phytoene synthase [Microbacterium sp. Root166]|uniref:phytoene/squalene synthase family protein n=1 Tax=Microbacterium sp. Root166 TaxID=1736478 RepID=UPI000700B787|nr:squalene/phytoene synthase family protein [Microbacterium sp. Root166]KQZ84575.1 phytoene synthase [Microbacterium sp. Root166]
MSPRVPRGGQPTGLELYDRTARDAAATVISRYSTSFSLACRLLGPRPRPHVRTVYALVRIADEVVDGPAAAAGLTPDAAREVLDALEVETLRAIETGFSTNLIVHAFALTARECGIGEDLVRPFFRSMRTDLSTARHDDASHDDYVYGSAEVVGLMCLQVFVNAGARHPAAPSPELTDGARRLGAAFQDVNFLRDLDHDASALGRDYLGLASGTATRTAVLDRIDADLAAAAAVVPDLPADCRRAVTAAHDLFAELSARLRAQAGTTQEGTTRVRVPDVTKARLAARAWLGFSPREVRP